MGNHHFINGKIHYFDWAIFHCYVSSPEGTYHYLLPLIDDLWPQAPSPYVICWAMP